MARKKEGNDPMNLPIPSTDKLHLLTSFKICEMFDTDRQSSQLFLSLTLYDLLEPGFHIASHRRNRHHQGVCHRAYHLCNRKSKLVEIPKRDGRCIVSVLPDQLTSSLFMMSSSNLLLSSSQLICPVDKVLYDYIQYSTTLLFNQL